MVKALQNDTRTSGRFAALHQTTYTTVESRVVAALYQMVLQRQLAQRGRVGAEDVRSHRRSRRPSKTRVYGSRATRPKHVGALRCAQAARMRST